MGKSMWFHKGFGCVDQIFTLKVVGEKAMEFNLSLYLAFMDLRKVYNTVNWEAL